MIPVEKPVLVETPKTKTKDKVVVSTPLSRDDDESDADDTADTLVEADLLSLLKSLAIVYGNPNTIFPNQCDMFLHVLTKLREEVFESLPACCTNTKMVHFCYAGKIADLESRYRECKKSSEGI